jgi:choice-of-anchor A domain-containing protein
MRAAVVATLLGMAGSAGIANAGPTFWDFNVYSRTTIGSEKQGYGSGIQGATGAAGDAWFSAFSGRTSEKASPGLPGGFYGGGTLTINGGNIGSGGVYVAGDVRLNGASIVGDITAGGDLSGDGIVKGAAYLGGSFLSAKVMEISDGVLDKSGAYKSPIELKAAAEYFTGVSSFAGSLTTNAKSVNNWGEIVITANDALTVVNLTSSELADAWGLRISGKGTVIVNVDGAEVKLDSKAWTYENGASSNTTLLNLKDATFLALSGGNNVNILAVNALTDFSSGVVRGNLIVDSLIGSGSVEWDGGFTGAEAIPSPGMLGMLATVGLLAARRQRR